MEDKYCTRRYRGNTPQWFISINHFGSLVIRRTGEMGLEDEERILVAQKRLHVRDLVTRS